MNSKQSELVERYQESQLQKKENPDEFESDSDDELMELLEEEEEAAFSKYREARLQQLSEEFKKVDDAHGTEMGELKFIHDEKEVMDIVTRSEHVIIHFQQPEFAKCKIMNERLTVLAEKHLTVKFIYVNASETPFLVTKLGIKVLPFVVGYIGGKEALRVVGFEKLGNDPNTFNVEVLEQLLYVHGIINRRTINFGSIKQKTKAVTEDSDDDLDL
ncbi:phosducin-like protein 1 [[Candida] anglica]|uniref:Phosducin-like protein 1 n=1 Tax=[Candida] anglica TaxID=148631 RepID=A0ABP0EQ45_9ASCO